MTLGASEAARRAACGQAGQVTVFRGGQPAEPGAEVLASAKRLSALREVGLSAASDEGMERFARLVASVLGVPVALVSLVEADRQVFPGIIGLAEPWATSRQTPLSHSLCQRVAASGTPLVLPDVRALRTSRATPRSALMRPTQKPPYVRDGILTH